MACLFLVFLIIFNCGSTSSSSSGDSDSGSSEGGSDGTASGTSGYSSTILTVSGTARTVAFYAPTSRGSSPPLVIAFHGTGGTPEEWIDESADSDPSGLEELANTNGFVIAAPQSLYIDEGDWDHEGFSDYYWETAAPNGQSATTNPDLMLVQDIITTAQSSYGINTDRIYVIGFSNGGFFAILTAMVLRDQIAAFAEAGSGLVTCDTTRSCTAQVASSTTCNTILTSAGCSCSGDEKPTTIPTSGRKVPGYLGHNNQDDTVSVYYTCALAARLAALGYTYDVQIGDAEGHGVPEGFWSNAWTFMSSRQLP